MVGVTHSLEQLLQAEVNVHVGQWLPTEIGIDNDGKIILLLELFVTV